MNMLRIDVDTFPNSFRLLQQEGFLTRSLLLTGFECLIKGRLSSKDKGHYYSAFFHLSISIERMMKLVLINDHMLKNSFQSLTDEDLRTLGHDLFKLYNKIKAISNEYLPNNIELISDDSLSYQILDFLNYFAKSNGRYYNISNISIVQDIDPLLRWQQILNDTRRKEFSSSLNHKIEEKMFGYTKLNLPMYDWENQTGPLSDIYSAIVIPQTNPLILWNIIIILKPFAEMLAKISCKIHNASRKVQIDYSPAVPYYDEFFRFLYLEKKEVIKKKRWTTD